MDINFLFFFSVETMSGYERLKKYRFINKQSVSTSTEEEASETDVSLLSTSNNEHTRKPHQKIRQMKLSISHQKIRRMKYFTMMKKHLMITKKHLRLDYKFGPTKTLET